MKNNKGFSLVELIVATAILSVIAVAVGLMLSTGANMFSRISRVEAEQSELQIAQAQIHERAIDCLGVYIDEDQDILYVSNELNEVFMFYVDENDKLMIAKANLSNGDPTEESGAVCSEVKSFSVDVLNSEEAAEGGAYTSAGLPLLAVSIELKDVSQTQYTALRAATRYPDFSQLVVALSEGD